MWFSGPEMGAICGGLSGALGAAVGITASFAFSARAKQKHRKAYLGFFLAVILVGLAMVAVGIAALFAAQPWYVCYGFLYPGSLIALLTFLAYRDLRKRYDTNPG